MVRYRTRVVWPVVIAYLAALGTGYVIGRLLGQSVIASLVLGLVCDVGVLGIVADRRTQRDAWARAGSWRW